MVHLFHASQVIRIANFAYFHAKFSAKALAQTFGVKSHLAFIHHLRRETLAASARKKSPTLYTPIYFLSVHYLPFRRLNYCLGVMKCEERSTLLEKRACASCGAKSAEFFDFAAMNRTILLQQVSVHAPELYICTNIQVLKTAHVHDRT